MTQKRKQVTLDPETLKALLREEEDFLKPLVQMMIQEVLEAEMNEALGAQKHERTGQRLGYRSG